MNKDQPYADPRDVEFGKAAKEKEELLETLEEEEQHETPPRPGGKAEPAG